MSKHIKWSNVHCGNMPKPNNNKASLEFPRFMDIFHDVRDDTDGFVLQIFNIVLRRGTTFGLILYKGHTLECGQPLIKSWVDTPSFPTKLMESLTGGEFELLLYSLRVIDDSTWSSSKISWKICYVVDRRLLLTIHRY